MTLADVNPLCLAIFTRGCICWHFHSSWISRVNLAHYKWYQYCVGVAPELEVGAENSSFRYVLASARGLWEKTVVFWLNYADLWSFGISCYTAWSQIAQNLQWTPWETSRLVGASYLFPAALTSEMKANSCQFRLSWKVGCIAVMHRTGQVSQKEFRVAFCLGTDITLENFADSRCRGVLLSWFLIEFNCGELVIIFCPLKFSSPHSCRPTEMAGGKIIAGDSSEVWCIAKEVQRIVCSNNHGRSLPSGTLSITTLVVQLIRLCGNVIFFANCSHLGLSRNPCSKSEISACSLRISTEPCGLTVTGTFGSSFLTASKMPAVPSCFQSTNRFTSLK